MAPSTPRRSGSALRTSTGGRLIKRTHKNSPSLTQSEPPKKTEKARYIPGGPGGGGRYVYADGTEAPVGGTGPGGYNYTGPRGKIGPRNAANGVRPPTPSKRRDKSTRTRTATIRAQEPKMRFGPDATSAAAAVPQSDGYKPREERGWEEFHPELDIDQPLLTFTADEVDGVAESRPVTPVEVVPNGTNGQLTPNGGPILTEQTPNETANGDAGRSAPGTPSTRRRTGRPHPNPSRFPAIMRAVDKPRIAPLEIQSAKERLTLPKPSFRKVDAFARFEDKAAGEVRYIDRTLAHFGYQETDIFIRPEDYLIRYSDHAIEDDLDQVEYDMDEADAHWLKALNERRKAAGQDIISHEIFEITITKIEKEWHALERRIPKPNPRPPQTHRPRSSSAAAVNGEPQAGEEQDSKCAICDDGDCENTNAIVFCDGCDLAVHQECYGVPFIPEGQWLCRKCQVAGRGVPTCIFCPNTTGGFKQTTSSKWAHLLCAMWIPEVTLGNHIFMEPIQDVERVPKARYKLNCFICNQKMGACIQCGNKNCFTAFHVTCARRAKLYLKMKNNHGTLSVLDVHPELMAFCDKHCPAEYSQQNRVMEATRKARRFYKKKMVDRVWVSSEEARERRLADAGQPITESQVTGARIAQSTAANQTGEPPKNIWKLPSGAPVIPQIIFEIIEKSLVRLNVTKRKEYTQTACRYWTLKRELRRGAPLIRRYQNSSEAFSSMEVTHRDFAGMGVPGRDRLDRRLSFAGRLTTDLDRLKDLTDLTEQREDAKVGVSFQEAEMVDTVYFPIHKLLVPVFREASRLDSKSILEGFFAEIQDKLDARYYITASSFMVEFGAALSGSLAATQVEEPVDDAPSGLSSPSKKATSDFKERRKFIKRILRAIQPLIESAFRAEADVFQKSEVQLLDDLAQFIEASAQLPPARPEIERPNENVDVDMADVVDDFELHVKTEQAVDEDAAATEPRVVDIDDQDEDAPGEDEDVANVFNGIPTLEDFAADSTAAPAVSIDKLVKPDDPDIGKSFDTPPDLNGYVSQPQTSAPHPPTPPISNGSASRGDAQEIPTDPTASLDQGGVPFYMKEFQPLGTTVVEPDSEPAPEPAKEEDQDEAVSELSDIDDEALKALDDVEMEGVEAEVPEVVVDRAALAKAKKARARRRNRW